MIDREKVMTGLELCTNISPDGCLMLCPYKDEKDEAYSGFCEQVLKQDALAVLKEQEAKIEHLKQPDCEHAEHDGIGCLGYAGSARDDEPIESCKRCKKYTGNIFEAVKQE